MPMTCVVRYQGEDRELSLVEGADSLSRLLFIYGFFRGRPLCSGAGKCGYCRVRFLHGAPGPGQVERDLFAEDELAEGWRLACRHPPLAGMFFELPDSGSGRESRSRKSPAPARRIGIDIGPTLIQWRACSEGEAGREHSLGEVGRSAVLDIAGNNDELVITGNSVMIALLTGKEVAGLGRAPYSLPWAGGCFKSVFPDLPPVYIPPLLAPFLGADVSSGVTYLVLGREHAPAYPFLYADMGTNAEFVLGLDPDTLYMASVPMGPALEGVGLRFGAPAGEGVVTGFELSPFGLESVLHDGAEANAVSGTGYISLLACLKRAGVIDHSGRFQEPVTPVASRIVGGKNTVAMQRVPLAGNMFLDGDDVEEVLKVKGAWNMAVSSLLREAGVASQELQAVYLAGSFGTHVQGDDLEELGFLPLGGGGKIRCVGNAALQGGCLLLERPEARQWCETLRKRTRVVDLVEADSSGNGLLERMRFSFIP